MLAKVCSAAVNGIEAYPVEVEVDSSWGESAAGIAGLNLPNRTFACGIDTELEEMHGTVFDQLLRAR